MFFPDYFHHIFAGSLQSHRRWKGGVSPLKMRSGLIHPKQVNLTVLTAKDNACETCTQSLAAYWMESAAEHLLSMFWIWSPIWPSPPKKVIRYTRKDSTHEVIATNKSLCSYPVSIHVRKQKCRWLSDLSAQKLQNTISPVDAIISETTNERY